MHLNRWNARSHGARTEAPAPSIANSASTEDQHVGRRTSQEHQPQRLLTTFNGRHVELQCDTEWLAAELCLKLGRLATAHEPAPRAVLRLALNERETDWIELWDSTGRCERGPLDFVLHSLRKWITAAFVSEHPDLLWLHAGAAARDGAVILLPGPPGAGKSTLVVRLLEREWQLLADDVVPLDLDRRTALPLPFNPSVRPCVPDRVDGVAFLEQPKTIVTVPPEQVAAEPTTIGAVVFPKFEADGSGAFVLSRISVVHAAQALAAQSLDFRDDKRRSVRAACRLAEAVPAYRLSYRDPARAAIELTERWPLAFRAR